MPLFLPLVAALLSFVAWQPFVRPDFNLWKADDGEYHLLRIYVFEKAVQAGEWLPRWTPDLFVGFGYPIFNYYAPGTYYAAMVLRAFHLDIYTTVQVLGALATCAGAAGAYCLARTVFGGRLPGFVAALAYAYAPYPFIANLLIRADLAETIGLALLPWALLAAWRTGRYPGRSTVAGLAAAIGAIALTHNLTALVALPAALAVGLFAVSRSGARDVPGIRPGNGCRMRALLAGTFLGLALTAFFWVPALAEQRYVQIEVALQGSTKAARAWLIDPLGATDQTRRAGNPQTVSGPLDLHLSYPYDLNYPPKPALFQGALFVASALVTVAGLARRRKGATEAAFFGLGTLALWLATTTWSVWAWERVPLMRFLQFSWRLYGPLALSLGLFGAGACAVAWPIAHSPESYPVDGQRPSATLRASRWGYALALLPLLFATALAYSATTARPLWIDPQVERRVGGAQLVGTENATFGAGTTTGGEFVPRAANFEAFGPGQRRGNGVYERLYPEFGWLGDRVRTLAGKLRVTSLAGGPTWTDARVAADEPSTLAFRTIAFPGWRAYVDGREVTPGLAPHDDALNVSPGFLTVDVPAGEHEVQIAFAPTRLHTAAAVFSVLTLAGLCWWLSAPRRAAGSRPARRTWTALAIAPAAVIALAVAHDAVRPVLGAPVLPRASDQRLVADVIQLTQQSKATISSPSGAALGPFVDIRRLQIAGRDRRWLYMHPPSGLSITLDLPPRAAFQAGLALDPQTWNAEGADGVIFQLDVTPQGGPTQRVLAEHVNPRARGEDRAWLDRWIDLSAFGGRRVTLTLSTDPAQTPDFDWAGWGDPSIVVQNDARRPGGGPPGPVATPRSS